MLISPAGYRAKCVCFTLKQNYRYSKLLFDEDVRIITTSTDNQRLNPTDALKIMIRHER